MQEGSSKGITEKNLVRSPRELEAQARFLLDTYDQPVIAEAFLPGAEFTCGVLGNGASARVLPLVGMNFDSLPARRAAHLRLRSEVDLGHGRRAARHLRVPGAHRRRSSSSAIEDVVLRAYRALGCRDWSRIDVRLDAERRAQHRRGESAARHSARIPKTIPACPRPLAPLVSTTISSFRARCVTPPSDTVCRSALRHRRSRPAPRHRAEAVA